MNKAGKRMKKLDRRRRDFDKGTTSNDAKVQNRWKEGGFHRPGSMSK